MQKRKSQRIMIKLTDTQMKELRKARALIAKELPELIKKDQVLHDAMREPTLSGALRRAIHGSKILLPDIAERAGTDMDTVDGFLTGERTLPSDVMDRLARVVKFKVVMGAKPRSRTARAG